MRREDRVTVQGPVKKQQPDGMSHSPPPPFERLIHIFLPNGSFQSGCQRAYRRLEKRLEGSFWRVQNGRGGGGLGGPSLGGLGAVPQDCKRLPPAFVMDLGTKLKGPRSSGLFCQPFRHSSVRGHRT